MGKKWWIQFTVLVGMVIHLIFFNAIAEFFIELFIELFAQIFGGAIGELFSWIFRQIKRVFWFVIFLILWPFRKLFGW